MRCGATKNLRRPAGFVVHAVSAGRVQHRASSAGQDAPLGCRCPSAVRVVIRADSAVRSWT